MVFDFRVGRVIFLNLNLTCPVLKPALTDLTRTFFEATSSESETVNRDRRLGLVG